MKENEFVLQIELAVMMCTVLGRTQAWPIRVVVAHSLPAEYAQYVCYSTAQYTYRESGRELQVYAERSSSTLSSESSLAQ